MRVCSCARRGKNQPDAAKSCHPMNTAVVLAVCLLVGLGAALTVQCDIVIAGGSTSALAAALAAAQAGSSLVDDN